MIIWLASYPRSGNTLLRTIFQHTMGRSSYSDEPVHGDSDFRRNPEWIGHVEWSGSWERFYEEATASPDPVLVKTHLPPRDRHPFLYVVRDGRSALQSYRRFHRDFNGRETGFAELILGADAYGDWTGHYEAWNARTDVAGKLLRFEDLVHAGPETLHSLADFVGHAGPVAPWRNPVDRLRKVEPRFFHRRETAFVPEPEWTPAVDGLFRALHGSLMKRLGFFAESEPVEALPGFSVMAAEIKATVHALRKNAAELAGTCDERLALIQRLDAECRRRAAEIERLRDADGTSAE